MARIKNISRILIAFIIIISSLAAYIASGVKFNYDIESFFSQSDPELGYYHNFRETFENDNDFILIGISNKTGIFQKDFLKKIDSLSNQLERFERIIYVNSPSNLTNSIVAPLGGVFKIPVIHIDNPDKYAADTEKIYGAKDYISAFFSPDTTAVSIFIKKEEYTPKTVNDSLLNAINHLLSSLDFDNYHIAGRIKTQNYYVGQMRSEMLLFMTVALLMVIGFLFFIFRNFWGVVIPLLVILIATIWTIAFIRITGGQLDLMMTMLPTLLFIIGISGSIHLLSKFIEEIEKGTEKLQAIKTTVRETGLATFLASFTTAIGFSTLMVMNIEPIQRFGFYTAVGVMFTFIVAILLLPIILINIDASKLAASTKNQLNWSVFLNKLFMWITGHGKIIITITSVIIIISIWGITKIKVNNYFLDDLSKESPLKKDLLYFEKLFSGIRPFEMGIDIKDTAKTIFDLDVLQEIEKVENHLVNHYGAGFLLTPATIIKTAVRAMNGGKNSNYKLPRSMKELDKVIHNLKKYGALRKFDNLITKNLKRGRISGKMKDIGSIEVKRLNEELSRFIQTNTSLADFHLTGAAELMDNTNSNIAINLVRGLGIAFLIIAMIVGILYRSVKTALASLIPNVLPLIIIAGLMGFLNIDLKVATALIFTIAFGIAVDDTIHMLSKLKIEIKKGETLENALKESFLTTGKAIIFTSFILSAGFVTFMLSDFQSIFNIGLLISITLFIAVVADLFLLPLLFMKKPSQMKGLFK